MLSQLPGARNLSEFHGRNGDCGELAEAGVIAIVKGVPLDAALLNGITDRDIAHGWAGANGAEPIGSIYNDLTQLAGIPATNYGYSEPPSFDWQGTLAQWGGRKPIIFEYARAGNLPGDEAGVQYHFNTCVAWDPDAQYGLFIDGDHANADSGALARYTLADLKNAQICAMIVVEWQPPTTAQNAGGSTPVSASLDINSPAVASFFYLTPAGTWHCKLTNQEIGNGFLATYRGMALSAPGMGTLNALALLGLPLTGELHPIAGTTSVQIFERGALVWDPKRQLDNPPGAGDTYFAHINSGPVLDFLASGTQQQLATATAALSQAQQQLATVQRQAQDAVSAAQASAAQAQQALAAAQAQAQADATSAAAQITSATKAQTAAEAQATQAQHDLEAAQAQVTSMQQQVADAAKGLAVVQALKAAMA